MAKADCPGVTLPPLRNETRGIYTCDPKAHPLGVTLPRTSDAQKTEPLWLGSDFCALLCSPLGAGSIKIDWPTN